MYGSNENQLRSYYDNYFIESTDKKNEFVFMKKTHLSSSPFLLSLREREKKNYCRSEAGKLLIEFAL